MITIVGVRFRGSGKIYYFNPNGLEIRSGTNVIVETARGLEFGTAAGGIREVHEESVPQPLKNVIRIATEDDVLHAAENREKEREAVIICKEKIRKHELEMKLIDAEYAFDNSKILFYFTADGRIDFRELVKDLASVFRTRIELRQIGVRDETKLLGGIGICGRPLCCSTWLTNFKSVTTSAAKTQQILPNPQKLAGQCGKLKCCLNFECDVYADALKKFPPANIAIRFKKGLAQYKKTDVFRGIMWYAYEGENDLYAIPAESVKKLIEMNHNQEYAEKLEDYQVELMSTAALAQETDNAEFERELRRMADDMGESDSQSSAKEQSNDRRGRGDRQNGRQRPANRGDRPERNDRSERPDRMERQERRPNPNRTGQEQGERRYNPNTGVGRRDEYQRPRNNPNAGRHAGRRGTGRDRHEGKE